MAIHPRISLIHATPLAVKPVNDAFATDWPEAQVFNLLEDSLAPDLSRDGQLTPDMTARFERLAVYAKETGADGILFTCSAFGPAIEQAAKKVSPILTLKPNEAMFEDAIKAFKRVGLVATFGPSLPSMVKEFKEMAQRANADIIIETAMAEGAMEALANGQDDHHNQLIAEAASTLADCDAIMLAQFSMAQAKDGVLKFYEGPVLTSPASAISTLKKQLLSDQN